VLHPTSNIHRDDGKALAVPTMAVSVYRYSAIHTVEYNTKYLCTRKLEKFISIKYVAVMYNNVRWQRLQYSR